MKTLNKGNAAIVAIIVILIIIIAAAVYITRDNGTQVNVSGGNATTTPITPNVPATTTATSTATSTATTTVSASWRAAVTQDPELMEAVEDVVMALNAKNYTQLENLTAVAGLTINNEPRLNFASVTVPKAAVSDIPASTTVRLWGYTDGKGDPINLTISQFINQYVYTKNYLSAPQVGINRVLGSGTTANTIVQNVGTRKFVSLHFPNSNASTFDWTTLYLVFDSENGEYKLRGIARDRWTI